VLEDSVAVISVNETERDFTTWSELRERVLACQARLRAMGLKPGE
jgi:acyl-coenzyme A synthetase/AMP-(fatty) acid ligase